MPNQCNKPSSFSAKDTTLGVCNKAEQDSRFSITRVIEIVAKVESILSFKEDQEIDIFFDDETSIENFSLYILGKRFSNQLDRYFPLSTFVVAFGKKATENEMA